MRHLNVASGVWLNLGLDLLVRLMRQKKSCGKFSYCDRVPDSTAEDSTAEDSTVKLYLSTTVRRSFSQNADSTAEF